MKDTITKEMPDIRYSQLFFIINKCIVGQAIDGANGRMKLYSQKYPYDELVTATEVGNN